MSKVLRSLLIILMFCSIAEGSNWQLIRPTPAENYFFYIDMESVRRLPKSKVRFWYTVAKSLEDARKDTYKRSYVEMDCLKKSYRDVTYEREEAAIVWENIAPDSFQESFYESVCLKKKPTALNENQKALSLSVNNSPGDEALHNMALVYADPGNPKRDSVKSIATFKRLIKEYPQSAWAGQAKIWLQVIQEGENAKRVAATVTQENDKLKRVIGESNKVDIEIEAKKKEQAK
jgi:hypothetical protein